MSRNSRALKLALWQSFDDSWDELADVGKVDEREGAQWVRLKTLWIERGEPVPTYSWIARQAEVDGIMGRRA